MNADGSRALLGVYLVTALFSMQTVQAKPPTKDLENRVAELEATALAVQAELDSINATINQLQTELAAEAATREDQVNQLSGRITTNESDISGNSTTIANHEARISTNESDIVANSALIEDNSNRINARKPSISVRANGTRIGTYLTTIEDASSGVPRDVMVMNDDEFIFRICATNGCGNQVEGELMRPGQRRFGDIIGYTSTDCSGQGYLLEENLETISGLGSLLKGSGYVFNTGGGIYYLPINSQPIEDKGSVTVRAVRSVNGFLCNPPSTYPRRLLYPVFPNDPSVTGVSTSSFALPLSLGF